MIVSAEWVCGNLKKGYIRQIVEENADVEIWDAGKEEVIAVAIVPYSPVQSGKLNIGRCSSQI